MTAAVVLGYCWTRTLYFFFILPSCRLEFEGKFTAEKDDLCGRKRAGLEMECLRLFIRFRVSFWGKSIFLYPNNITRQTPKLLSRSGRKMWNNSNAKSIQFDEAKIPLKIFLFSRSLLRPSILRHAIMPSEGKATKPISFHPLGNLACSESDNDERHREKQSETREIMKIVNRRKSSPIKDCLLHWNLICEWFTPPEIQPKPTLKLPNVSIIIIAQLCVMYSLDGVEQIVFAALLRLKVSFCWLLCGALRNFQTHRISLIKFVLVRESASGIAAINVALKS